MISGEPGGPRGISKADGQPGTPDGWLVNRAVMVLRTARREEGTRALQQAMEAISVDSVVREPAHEREAVHIAFLVDVDQEPEVERVIEDLAREWEGRIDVRLLGPMAAYDFARTDSD